MSRPPTVTYPVLVTPVRMSAWLLSMVQEAQADPSYPPNVLAALREALDAASAWVAEGAA